MADAAQGVLSSINDTLLEMNGSLHRPLDPFEVWDQRQHEVQHYRETHPEEAREARDALISVYLTLVRNWLGASLMSQTFWRDLTAPPLTLLTWCSSASWPGSLPLYSGRRRLRGRMSW